MSDLQMQKIIFAMMNHVTKKVTSTFLDSKMSSFLGVKYPEGYAQHFVFLFQTLKLNVIKIHSKEKIITLD